MNLKPFPLSFLALVILMSCGTKSQDTFSTNEITAWVLLQKFSILSDLLVDEDGGESEFTSKWLVKSKGRWMYRDYGNYFAEVDTNYHYVFTKI